LAILHVISIVQHNAKTPCGNSGGEEHKTENEDEFYAIAVLTL